MSRSRSVGVARSRPQPRRSTPSAARGGRSPSCIWSRSNYPLRIMHGYGMPTRQAIELLRGHPQEPRSCPPCRASRTSPSRGARCFRMVPWCSSACSRSSSRLRCASRYSASARACVYSLMSDNERRKDPLLSFCAEFAQQRSRDAEHALGAVRLDRCPVRWPPGPRRRMRSGGCGTPPACISDTGWRAHPDYRGEQSLILITHAALAGIDHPGRVFLALPSTSGTSVSVPMPRMATQLSEKLKEIVSKKQFRRAPHHRSRHPGRPYAVDRPGRYYRRDAAELRG